MIKRILVLVAVVVITACAATENITVISHSYVPFVYHHIQYEHPVDAVYFGGRAYPGYKHHGAYVYMSNAERLEVDHYLRSLNHCYSGNWFITGVTRQGFTRIEGDNGRRCDGVMRVYRTLYKHGYSWQSLGDVIGQGPFFDLLKTEDKCKLSGGDLDAVLTKSGEAHFSCNSDVKK